MLFPILWITLISLFLPFCSIQSEESSFTLINRAELLFNEGLPLDALLLYEKATHTTHTIHNQLDSLSSPLLIIRQAECQFRLQNYSQASSLLKDLHSPLPQSWRRSKDYLLALTHRSIGQYEQAITLLEQLKKEDSSSDSFQQAIGLEIGINYFYLKQFDKARSYLTEIHLDPLTPDLFPLAHLYLVRMALIQEEWLPALSILTSLSSSSPLLKAEIAYLQGIAYFNLKNYQEAIKAFAYALRVKESSQQDWDANAMQGLLSGYLKIATFSKQNKEELKLILEKGEKELEGFMSSLVSVQSWQPNRPKEQLHLLLAKFYLAKIYYLKDRETMLKAEKLLNTDSYFTSQGAKEEALLLRTQLVTHPSARALLYDPLIQEAPHSSCFYSQCWYLKGTTDLELGHQYNIKNQLLQAQEAFHRAADSFAKSYTLSVVGYPSLATLALEQQAIACYYQGNPSTKQRAWSLLKELIDQDSTTLKRTQEPARIYYLATLIALESLLDNQQPVSPLNEIEDLVETGTHQFSCDPWIDQMIKNLAIFYFKQHLIEKSDQLLDQLLQRKPELSLQNEIWLLKAKCAEQGKDEKKKQMYLQKIFVSHPESPLAPQAYLNFHSFYDYMNGNRKAIRHLQGMPNHFPHHPLSMTAHYLTGLYYKKDHFTAEGKIQYHKNLTTAIDYFQQAETLFNQLYEDDLISPEDLLYFTQIRYRATLERALVNLAIAKESQGSKRHIYLCYAGEVLEQMMTDFHACSFDPIKLLYNQSLYPKLLEENEFWLAQVYIEREKLKEAEALLDHMHSHYQTSQQTKGYLLARSWDEKGKIAQRHQQPNKALECFIRAEQVAYGLSADQRLDLWIQQSVCYKELNQLEVAISTLSKVINDESISSLRLKAMYLRAELYEAQGKPELALKQLESVVKKGGEWGQKAREKIKNGYTPSHKG